MTEDSNSPGGFGGLRVLALESRRAREMSVLISNSRGEPIVAPATREVAAEDNGDALKFVSALREGRLDMVIFLTGVGTRALAQAAEGICPREEFLTALGRTAVVARGPKPVAALRELGVPIAAIVPEPNTWRELLHLLDEKSELLPLKGRSVAVQEYGVPSPELLAGLAERGAQVLPVRIYEWSLPEDTAPLRQAIHAITRGEIDVLLVTAAVQVRHLLQVAEEMNLREDLIRTLARVLVGSIGPVTSAELRQQGIAVDLEPSHPKMGFLVKEIAERCTELMRNKRDRSPRVDPSPLEQ
jgi:uroporphyrinogen-III synthase